LATASGVNHMPVADSGTASTCAASRDMSSPPTSSMPIREIPYRALPPAVNWSGESPDEGRFPVRPSSLTPSAARRRTASKAGVTRDLSRRGARHVIAPGRSQPGGPGKHAGRSMTRTMQRRNFQPRRILLAETGARGWRLADRTRKPGIAAPAQREGVADPPA